MGGNGRWQRAERHPLYMPSGGLFMCQPVDVDEVITIPPKPLSLTSYILEYLLFRNFPLTFIFSIILIFLIIFIFFIMFFFIYFYYFIFFFLFFAFFSFVVFFFRFFFFFFFFVSSSVQTPMTLLICRIYNVLNNNIIIYWLYKLSSMWN